MTRVDDTVVYNGYFLREQKLNIQGRKKRKKGGKDEEKKEGVKEGPSNTYYITK